MSVEALAVDAIAVSILFLAGPNNDEVALRIHGDHWVDLVAEGCCIDLKFRTLCDTSRVVATGINSPAAAILIVARPSNDVVAGGTRCDRAARSLLIVVRRGVDLHIGIKLHRLTASGTQW